MGTPIDIFFRALPRLPDTRSIPHGILFELPRPRQAANAGRIPRFPRALAGRGSSNGADGLTGRPFRAIKRLRIPGMNIPTIGGCNYGSAARRLFILGTGDMRDEMSEA